MNILEFNFNDYPVDLDETIVHPVVMEYGLFFSAHIDNNKNKIATIVLSNFHEKEAYKHVKNFHINILTNNLLLDMKLIDKIVKEKNVKKLITTIYRDSNSIENEFIKNNFKNIGHISSVRINNQIKDIVFYEYGKVC